MLFEELEVLRAVVDAGSFTRASEALGLTQAGVSRSVKSLEQRLGVAVFERRGRSLVLTEAGRYVRDGAYPLLAQVVVLREAARSLAAGERGRVRFGATFGCGDYLLPSLLCRFHAERPRVEISLRIAPREEIVSALLSGQLDLAVVSGELQSERLRVEPIYSSDFILIASVEVARRLGTGPTTETLSAMPFVLPLRDSDAGRAIGDALRAAQIRPKASIEMGSIESIQAAVEAGHGVGCTLRCSAANRLARGGVVEIRTGGMPIGVNFNLITPRGIQPTPLATALISFLHRELSEQGRESRGDLAACSNTPVSQ